MSFKSQDIGQFIRGLDKALDDPRMWLITSIEEAKDKENTHELVILLNIFFESMISTWLSERWEEKELTDKEEKWLDQNYYRKLRLARDLEFISDNEFNLLDLLRESRNHYAHNVNALHPDNKSKIEKEDKLDKVYEYFSEIPVSVTTSLE